MVDPLLSGPQSQWLQPSGVHQGEDGHQGDSHQTVYQVVPEERSEETTGGQGEDRDYQVTNCDTSEIVRVE